MLLKRDRDGAAEVVSIHDATHAYRTWWASPVRTSLYAFALTIDVAAFPIEVLGLWWLARGLRE